MSNYTALTAGQGGIGSINGQSAPHQTISVLVNGLETVASANGSHVATINLAGSAYVHTQAVAATTWTINHNLGYRPAVTLFTTGGVEFDAQVVHTSINQTVISLVLAIAGSARLV